MKAAFSLLALRPSLVPALALLLLGATPAHAIRIDVRYDYDTQGFFNPPEARAAMRAVADYYEALLHDTLLPINPADFPGGTWSATFSHPGTGNTQAIPSLVVPQDTIIVYAGGRDLGTPSGRGGPGGFQNLSGAPAGWVTRVTTRGQAGAGTTPATDFAPWGGSIAFNNARSWNFSLSTPVSSLSPFVTIALHEMGHLLGIGLASSWTAKVSGSNFTGPASKAVFGANVPLASGNSHWRDDGRCALPDGHVPSEPNNVLSKAYGTFEVPHGYPQIALMDPSTCSAGPFFKVMTDLDLAALRDIGWQLEPPLRFETLEVNPPALAFSWPSTSGITYELQRSTTLSGAWTSLKSQKGNGELLTYEASNATGAQAFFRLSATITPALQAGGLAAAGGSDSGTGSEAAVDSGAVYSQPERVVEDCHCGESWGD